MKKLFFVFVGAVMIGLSACDVNEGYTRNEVGVEYKFIEQTDGKKPGENDIFLVQMQNVHGDSILMETVTEEGLSLSPNQGPELLTSVLSQCAEGDSVHIRMTLADYSVITRTMMTADMDTAEMVIWKFRVTKVVDRNEFLQKKQEEAIAMAEAQLAEDKASIEKYIADNNLNAQQTEEGIYYVVEKAGRGRKPNAGEFVQVEYTVRLMDGTFIDSSDAELNKQNEKFAPGRQYGPYKFKLGQGSVIRGWDLSIGLINKGTKAKILIPSKLGYGPNPRPGGGIPPNAVLIFDVELVEIGE